MFLSRFADVWVVTSRLTGVFYETSGSVTTWEKTQLNGLEFFIRHSIKIVFIPAVVNLMGLLRRKTLLNYYEPKR